MNASDLGKVYGALLSSPGMNEAVRIDLKINRRVILLLSQVIEIGLGQKTGDGQFGMAQVVSKEELDELNKLSADCIEKAGLTELKDKLSNLSAKQ